MKQKNKRRFKNKVLRKINHKLTFSWKTHHQFFSHNLNSTFVKLTAIYTEPLLVLNKISTIHHTSLNNYQKLRAKRSIKRSFVKLYTYYQRGERREHQGRVQQYGSKTPFQLVGNVTSGLLQSSRALIDYPPGDPSNVTNWGYNVWLYRALTVYSRDSWLLTIMLSFSVSRTSYIEPSICYVLENTHSIYAVWSEVTGPRQTKWRKTEGNIRCLYTHNVRNIRHTQDT